MKVFAHRGFHAQKRENTLESFHAAQTLGITGIETDIRLDRIGLPFLYHNPRATNGTPVSALTLAELRAAEGFHIPSLAEALTEIQNLTWNLELKTLAAVEPAVAVIRRFTSRAEIFISSFVHEAVLAATAATGLPGGFLISHTPLRPEALLAGTIKTLIWNFETASPAALQRATGSGITNWVYGIPAPADHATLPANVAAVITDYPNDPFINPHMSSGPKTP